jgi:hypothetical protein
MIWTVSSLLDGRGDFLRVVVARRGRGKEEEEDEDVGSDIFRRAIAWPTLSEYSLHTLLSLSAEMRWRGGKESKVFGL